MNTLIRDLYKYAKLNDKISLRKLQFISSLDVYKDALANAIETIANEQIDNYPELLELKKFMEIYRKDFIVSAIDLRIISLVAEKGNEASLNELYNLAEKYTSLRKIWEDITSFVEICKLDIDKKEYEEIREKLPDKPVTEQMINLWCNLAEIHGYLSKMNDERYLITKEGEYILVVAKYILNNMQIPKFYEFLLKLNNKEVEIKAAKKLLALKPV
ncbi:MAG: hypothetical protein J7K83_04000 [Candidatus Aenigmarchaeota archaeon]|nr:hypothetical protein [Candidatus Aenigmarchaeota archaeon]